MFSNGLGKTKVAPGKKIRGICKKKKKKKSGISATVVVQPSC